MWEKEVVANTKIRGERKQGNGWQRVIGEILLLYGRIFDLYRNDIYLRYVVGGIYKKHLQTLRTSCYCLFLFVERAISCIQPVDPYFVCNLLMLG